MRNNLFSGIDGYVQPCLVNLVKNQKNLSEETNQKVEAVAEVEKG